MRILLSEDDRSLSSAIATILKYNNYAVDCAYDGEEALAFLKNDIYDILILDLMMPKLDGISVLKIIRKNNNSIPVLILTAKSDVEDKVNGLENGADDYLTKPFSSKELIARIKALTRRNLSFNNQELQFGNLKLNRNTFELISSNNKILLTSKEFQIMEILFLHPNQIITSETILDKVWGYDGDISIVWSYISYLRKKLILLEANFSIKGIRNIGYKLEINDDKKTKN